MSGVGRCIAIAVCAVVAVAGRAGGEGPLQPDSSGLDWRQAPARDRLTWTNGVTAKFAADETAALAISAGLLGCLGEMVTPRSQAERKAVAIAEDMSLSDLTAMCLIGLGVKVR